MDISNAPILMVYATVIIVLLTGSQAGTISLLHLDNLNVLLTDSGYILPIYM